MEASRELDALVAEKVMGWVVKEGFFVEFAHSAISFGPRWSMETPLEAWKPIPTFSFDMHSAWQVIEKLSDKFYCQLTSPYLPHEPYWCYFEYHGTSDTHPLWQASATTAPLAICLAALKAVGVELEAGEDEIL